MLYRRKNSALPLGEVARRSRDGEGESLPIFKYRNIAALSVFSLRSNPALPEGEPSFFSCKA